MVRFVVTLAVVLTVPASALADRYFVVVMSYQEQDRTLPWNSHNFATFAAVADDGAVSEFTISWYPARLGGAVVGTRGFNRGLHETIARGLGQGFGVSAWGPFEIRKELFDAAYRRKVDLDSGRYRWKFFEPLSRRREILPSVNCIHAMADVVTCPRRLVTGIACGSESAAMVAQLYSPWFIRHTTSSRHDRFPAVADALGLNRYPITWHETRR